MNRHSMAGSAVPAAGPIGPDQPLSLAAIGALVGDPVRAAILIRLTDGTRRPATELATVAGASPQAASVHLAKLVDGGLLRVESQGRHRFFSLASGEAAEMIEDLTTLAPPPRWSGPRRLDPALCHGRFCYDHLAGQLGVAITDRMAHRGWLVLGPTGLGLSEPGRAWCARHGLEFPDRPRGRRPVLRLCLDWTERRHHAGGLFGAALARWMIDTGYLRRRPGQRAIDVTAEGAAFLAAELAIDVHERGPALRADAVPAKSEDPF